MTTETKDYVILSSFRSQCQRCHAIGEAFSALDMAEASGIVHAKTCTPADPFMTDENGISLTEGDIQKREVKEIPGINYLTWLYLGHCHVTFVNRKINERFTYHIQKAKPRSTDPEGTKPPHFISILTGSNNTEDYSFIGTVFHNEGEEKYVHSKKSGLSAEAPSVHAFQWILQTLVAGAKPEWLEIWHEGRCAVCGRMLTDPDSIVIGIGPTCAGRL